MGPDSRIEGTLREAADGKPISKAEAECLLAVSENSLEAALLRSVANCVSRKRFSNSALLLGQIGVDMAPCDGGCTFCAFAKPHTTVKPSLLPTDEVVARCEMFARGRGTSTWKASLPLSGGKAEESPRPTLARCWRTPGSLE
jgi:biotin synthase